MSILQPSLPGALVLDLFAGSGALGLEALSRGAARVDFVELGAESLRALRDNIAVLGAEAGSRVHRGDALRFVAKLEEHAYDLVFADPPYGLDLASRLAARWLRRPFSGILSVEHHAREKLPGSPEVRRYGDTAISFYDSSRIASEAGSQTGDD
jgi:16S rRNA (guanine966-N2)-methyltransferase